MVHLYQLLVKKAVVYHTLTTFSTDDNDPTSNNSISAFLQKTVMERSNAPLTCCIRKSNHNNHLAKNMMDLQQGDYIFFEIASTVLLYFDIMENVLNKVGHLLSEFLVGICDRILLTNFNSKVSELWCRIRIKCGSNPSSDSR